MRRGTVSHDGRETAFWTDEPAGDGPVVLYVHGSGCRHDVWHEQIGREGAVAVTMDLSGHGDSTDVDTEAGPETMTAYVRDVDAVAREVEADVLVGHSLGGAVVLSVLLDGDTEPAAVVIADSGADFTVGQDVGAMLGDDIEPTLAFLAQADILFHADDHEHAESTDQIMREVGVEMRSRDLSTCNEFDVSDRLDEIDVPALCIVGDEDPLTPPQFTEYLAEHIDGGEYAEVPGAAHMAMLENAPAFNDALDSFIARVA